MPTHARFVDMAHGRRSEWIDSRTRNAAYPRWRDDAARPALTAKTNWNTKPKRTSDAIAAPVAPALSRRRSSVRAITRRTAAASPACREAIARRRAASERAQPNGKATKRSPCAVWIRMSTALRPSFCAAAMADLISAGVETARPWTSRITSPAATPFSAAAPLGSTADDSDALISAAGDLRCRREFKAELGRSGLLVLTSGGDLFTVLRG